MIFKKISFDEIIPVWRCQLWPDRQSPIESHSVMTWPWTSNSKYDMSIFDRPAIYWGCYDNKLLVGVNSGHGTSESEYRSRGLWVDPEWRNQGIGQMLLSHTCDDARYQGYDMVWSLPRVSALRTYQKAGFTEVGDQIPTETSELNVYVRQYL